MGAQWKHKGRTENSAARGQLFGKLAKEIMVAAKSGAILEGNARLRAAVESAKKSSVPRDTIERAIKKGAGLLDEQIQFETVPYEGFAPHRVPIIVECLTDNKNRTAADIRVLFRKGQLGAMGSVSWMFERLGIVEATVAKTGIDLETVAIESNAQNVEPLELSEVAEGHSGGRFFCDPKDLDVVSKSLTQMGWTLTLSELRYFSARSMIMMMSIESTQASRHSYEVLSERP